jgi:hypothetical protein
MLPTILGTQLVLGLLATTTLDLLLFPTLAGAEMLDCASSSAEYLQKRIKDIIFYVWRCRHPQHETEDIVI